MRRLCWLFAVAVACLALAGCEPSSKSTRERMKTWIGQSKLDLIASWGPPAKVMEDGFGGEVLIYTRATTYTRRGTARTDASATSYGDMAYGHSTTRYTPETTSVFEHWETVFVNGRGVIYRIGWGSR